MARDRTAYAGREQAYVKHYLLETYLDRLIHKTASRYERIVYVDGYSGPWQNAGQNFEDTSFGIALGALRRAKASWAKAGKAVEMSAFLVEQASEPYETLKTVPALYPDIRVHTYHSDFRKIAPNILASLPSDAFVFLFIDPKGWRINLRELEPLLKRPNAEVIFNFMFEFINRAASMGDPALSNGLDELIPYGDWRSRIAALPGEKAKDPIARKKILIEAFSHSLAVVGGYQYVAETPVLRPIKDRTLYSLIYATRKPVGLEVFRDCQVATLGEQSLIRGEAKIQAHSDRHSQIEMFSSFTEMAPDETLPTGPKEMAAAEELLKNLIPYEPTSVRYGDVWPQVLARHVVRKTQVGDIAAKLKNAGDLVFTGWQPRKRKPDDEYRVSRATPP